MKKIKLSMSGQVRFCLEARLSDLAMSRGIRHKDKMCIHALHVYADSSLLPSP